MNKTTFEKQICINASNSDFAGRMTLSGMLREAQTIAIEHCDSLGFDEGYLQSIHRVFLLTKLEIDITRPPMRGETITLRTTPYAPDRILYPRATRFYDSGGELLASIHSLWVFFDTERMRISRKAPELDTFPFEPMPNGWIISMPADRGVEPVGSVRVRYSMVDQNLHLNNAYYADIVCDAMEETLFDGAVIRKFAIVYHREAKPGAMIDLSLSRLDANAYIAGHVDGTMCFEAMVDF